MRRGRPVREAESGNKLAVKAPVTTAKLLEVIAATLQEDDRLRIDCEKERTEAVKIALAGLAKTPELEPVRQAWTELGQLTGALACLIALLTCAANQSAVEPGATA